DVARFGSGARAHRLAALDVTASDQSLASADDAQQEELLAGRALFLNAQLSEFQVLVRAEPVDLSTHLARIQQQALGLPEALAALARDYVVFLQTLAHQRTLLERRCYVILPLPEPAHSAGGRGVLELVRRWLGRDAPADAALAEAELARQLTARCDQAARDLARSGLQTRRLSGLGYAQLAHRCWAPEQARAQRFQREIDDYTTLVVGADRRRGDGTLPVAPRPAEPGSPEPRRALSRDERLLALGARTLADLVATGACEVYQDHLRLDGQYARVLALTAYPRTVTAGWLAPLVESDLPIELSVHVRPIDSAAMVRGLATHVARLQASRLAALRGERVADPEQEIALEDAERLRAQLQRGDERVFSVSLYVLVRAASPRALDDLTRRVENLLDGMLAHSRRLRWQQESGFRSCLPEGRDQVLVTRNLDTSALAATLPFVGSSLSMEHGVLYGVSGRTQEPIIVDPFDDRFDNAHLAVMAPTGSGKSYFVKLQALRSLLGGTDYLVVDPENEYHRLAEAVGGQVVRLAPSSRDQINPLDLVLPDPSADLGGPDGALAEAIATVVGRLELLLCAGMGPDGSPGLLDVHERALLDRALHQTYAAAGITPDTAGDGRPAPPLADLQAMLARTEGELAAQLALRLERHARAGLFAGRTAVSLDRALVVFEVRDLPRELWPLAIHWIGGHVWTLARRQRRPRRLVADEAATLLAHPSGGAFLAELARRARKHYLGLVTLVQKVGDLTGSEHGDTILTNAAMKLLLKQRSDTIASADARFRLTGEERRWLLGAGKGEGLLLVENQRQQLRILASRAEHRLITTNPHELVELEAQRAADATASPIPSGVGASTARNGLAARKGW
ncbi:MAG: DUF87 domain-containing protein, partial [Chloroflexi bacterium]|nr:DUF87 domain-containing protein [Chloroflexota bacterium]